MKKLTISVISAGLAVTAWHETAAAETLRSLYETACAAHGIDQERCDCILGQISERHDGDAARYLALDMNLRYEDAASLLEKIGEDEALAVGTTFDEAQNLDCSSNRLAQLSGTYQNGSSGVAVAAATGAEKAEAATLAEVVSEPLQVLRGPHPYLDFSGIKGDVDVIISVVMQSQLVSATSRQDIRPYLAWYEIADTTGGIDVSGNGEVDIKADAPAYASLVQSQTLSPKMYFPTQTGSEQVIGQIRFRGGSIYAPLVRYKPANAAASAGSLEALSNMTSIEDLTEKMSQPQNLHFVFPTDTLGVVNAFHQVSENSFGLKFGAASGDDTVQALDALVIINSLNRSAAK